MVITRSPELTIGESLGSTDLSNVSVFQNSSSNTLTSSLSLNDALVLPSPDIDIREFMISLPRSATSWLYANSAADEAFTGFFTSILPIPEVSSAFIPYGSSILNETRTVAQLLTADLSNSFFGELPNDSSLIRLRQLREAVVQSYLERGGVYRPGDVLPQNGRMTVFHFVLTRIFNLFRPETLVHLLNYLSQMNSVVAENSQSLGAIATIFLVNYA